MKYYFLLILILTWCNCQNTLKEENNSNYKNIDTLMLKDIIESNYDTTNRTINLIINNSLNRGLLYCESDSVHHKFTLKNENDSIFFMKDKRWNFLFSFLYNSTKRYTFQNDNRYKNIYFMPLKRFDFNRYTGKKNFYALIIGKTNSENEYLLIIDKYFKIYAIAYGIYSYKEDKFGLFQYKGSLDTLAFGTFIGRGQYY